MVKQTFLSCLPIQAKNSRPTQGTKWQFQLQEKEVSDVSASPPLHRPVSFLHQESPGFLEVLPTNSNTMTTPLSHHGNHHCHCHHDDTMKTTSCHHDDTMKTTSSHSSMSSSTSPCSSSCSRSLPRSSSENSVSISMDATTEMTTTATQTETDYEDFLSVITQGYSQDRSFEGLSAMLAQHDYAAIDDCLPIPAAVIEQSLADAENGNDDEDEDEIVYDTPWDVVQGNFMSMFCIDEKEVTLHRQSISDKLGLTLCYLDRGDTTLVYVGEVDPSCVAGENKEIQKGDHILQINGVPVNSRQQAIELFTSQLTISLKIARYILQVDDGFQDDSPTNTMGVEDLKHRCGHDSFQCHLEADEHTSDTNSTSRSKQDSGFSRTDDSIRTEESSEQEGPDTYGPHLTPPRHANSSFSSNDVPYDEITPPPPPRRKIRTTSVCCQTAPPLPPKNCDTCIDNIPSNTADNGNAPNNTPSNGYSNCGILVNDADMLLGNGNIPHKPPQAPGKRRRESSSKKLRFTDSPLPDMPEHIYAELFTSTSQPITTLTSPNGNTPLTIDASLQVPKTETSRSPRLFPRMGTKLVTPSKPSCSKCSPVQTVTKENGNSSKSPTSTQTRKPSSVSQPSPQIVRKISAECPLPKSALSNRSPDSAYHTGESLAYHDSAGFNMSMLSLAVPPCSTTVVSDDGRSEINTEGIYGDYTDVMYTTEANLYHTIAIQQKLFQQQMENQSRQRKVSEPVNFKAGQSEVKKVGQAENSKNSQGVYENCRCSGAQQGSVAMEWVVKRRADGSRYITRRPIRSKMLKERARKLNEERCGLTTDDDAMSELKVGKYWSREERKKHLEKARQHRQQKQALAQQKLSKEGSGNHGNQEHRHGYQEGQHSNQNSLEGRHSHGSNDSRHGSHDRRHGNHDSRHGDSTKSHHRHRHRNHQKEETSNIVLPGRNLLSVTMV